MGRYTLVNPHIEGSFLDNISGKSALEYATNVWTNLSKELSKAVPKFPMTVQNGDKYEHFLVKEKTAGDGSANFEISPITVKGDFQSRLQKQTGGKKDDDSSSSSSDYYKYKKYGYNYNMPWTPNCGLACPITHVWYDPMFYGLETVYIPTFLTNPFVEVTTISYYPY